MSRFGKFTRSLIKVDDGIDYHIIPKKAGTRPIDARLLGCALTCSGIRKVYTLRMLDSMYVECYDI